jgi:hypothetical protein
MGQEVVHALLAQPTGDQVLALWCEDHLEVPRSDYRATGTRQGCDLVLALTGDLDATATLTGLVNR